MYAATRSVIGRPACQIDAVMQVCSGSLGGGATPWIAFSMNPL